MEKVSLSRSPFKTSWFSAARQRGASLHKPEGGGVGLEAHRIRHGSILSQKPDFETPELAF